MRIFLHSIQLPRPAVSPAGPSRMHRSPRDCRDTKRCSRTNSGGKVSSPQPRPGGKREGHTGDPILAIVRRSQHQLRHCVMARDAHPTVRDRSQGRGYGSRALPAPTYFRWWTSSRTPDRGWGYRAGCLPRRRRRETGRRRGSRRGSRRSARTAPAAGHRAYGYLWR